MARFVTLIFPSACAWLTAGGLGFTLVAGGVQAATVPLKPAAAPSTNGAPINPPLPPPDTLSRYGKILTPGDEMAHPLKLKMPFPGVGEVKIPNADELSMRDKLEQLAKLSDADIRIQLDKWPAYGKMSLRDQGTMLQRIQDFRDYRANVAKAKAHDVGLLTLLPDQQAKFENEYWTRRLQMDRDLAKQFEPILRARQQKMQDELYREYSAVSQGPIVQVPKPPAPGATPAIVKTPSSLPGPAVSATTTNMNPAMQPMAQAPH
jgi:hypothetical protein